MKNSTIGKQIILVPESADSIRDEAERLLKRAKAIGIYPTPIEEIIKVAGLKEITDFEEARFNFLKTASAALTANLNSAFNKIRGLADLKKNSIYVAKETNQYRENWTRLHELGHHTLEWQNVQRHHADDAKSLSVDCEELFDTEANLFAADVLFQGKKFKEIAESHRPDFDNFFKIADMHGASKQSTARRFVENCDEPILIISYYKSKYSVDHNNKPIFILGRSHSYSEKFIAKYEDLVVPQRLDSNHLWYEACKSGNPISGEISLRSISSSETFLWQAWWNQYNLLVMVRKKPKLQLIKGLLNR